MRFIHVLMLAASLVAAGCVAGGDEDGIAPAGGENDDSTQNAGAGGAGLWGDAERLPLVAWERTGGFEFDVLCNFGGVGPIERTEDGGVYEGAAAVEFVISDAPGSAMMQLGYSVDEGEITWFPTAGALGGTWRAEALPDQTEAPGEERWVFHYRMNAPEPADQDCYTGAAAGPLSMRIDAVRG